MKVRHVFAALLLACSFGQSALAQEETSSAAKPEAAAPASPAAHESNDAGQSKSHSRRSHRTRKHAAKTPPQEQASGASGNAADEPVKAESAAAEKSPVEKSTAEKADVAKAGPEKTAEKTAETSAPVEKTPADNLAPEKAAALAVAAQSVALPKPTAEPAAPPVTAATAQPGGFDNFLYSIKATDLLIVLFAGLLVLIARTQAQRLDQAVKATSDTAQSAEKTARTAENALVAGQRAFMFLREFKTYLHLDDATGQYRWTLHPVWENSGNTPTKGLEIYTTYRLLDEPLPRDYDFPSAQEDMVTAIAGPRALVEGAPGGIGAEDLAAVQQGTKYFYIWGRAEYHDIFEGTGKHTTRFCNQLMQVIGDPSAPIGEHNMVQMMFGFHSENNGAE